MLKPGDTVTVGLSTTLPVMGKYEPSKPTASVTRTLGDNPEADLEDVVVQCKRVLHRCLVEELQFRGEVWSLHEETDGDIDALCQKLLERHVDVDEENIVFHTKDSEPGSPKAPAKHKPKAKAGGKLPKKKVAS